MEGVKQNSPDDHTLVLTLNQHIPVHVVGQSPNMGRILIGSLQFATGTEAQIGHSALRHMLQSQVCGAKVHNLCGAKIRDVPPSKEEMPVM